MRRLALAAAVLGVGIATPVGIACGTLESSAPPAGDAGTDVVGESAAPPPAPPPASGPCDPDAPFTSVHDIVELNAAAASISSSISTPRLTKDELHVYFEASARGKYDLWTAERASLQAPFTNARIVSSEPDASIVHPTVDGDGTELFFARFAAPARAAIFRAALVGGVPTGPPQAIGSGSGGDDYDPFLLEKPRQLWFVTTRENPTANQPRIYVSSDTGNGFVTAIPFDTGIEAGAPEFFPVLSADALTLYFSVYDATTTGARMYRSRRASPGETFGPPKVVSELVTIAPAIAHMPGWISPDHCRLYLSIAVSVAEFKLAVASR